MLSLLDQEVAASSEEVAVHTTGKFVLLIVLRLMLVQGGFATSQWETSNQERTQVPELGFLMSKRGDVESWRGPIAWPTVALADQLLRSVEVWYSSRPEVLLKLKNR